MYHISAVEDVLATRACWRGTKNNLFCVVHMSLFLQLFCFFFTPMHCGDSAYVCKRSYLSLLHELVVVLNLVESSWGEQSADSFLFCSPTLLICFVLPSSFLVTIFVVRVSPDDWNTCQCWYARERVLLMPGTPCHHKRRRRTHSLVPNLLNMQT